jgi:hypothetical protein
VSPTETAVRQVAAEMVRQWAEKRLRATALSGSNDRIIITRETRELFEQCAEDIEHGIR